MKNIQIEFLHSDLAKDNTYRSLVKSFGCVLIENQYLYYSQHLKLNQEAYNEYQNYSCQSSYIKLFIDNKLKYSGLVLHNSEIDAKLKQLTFVTRKLGDKNEQNKTSK